MGFYYTEKRGRKMSKVTFTNEEIEILKSNRYVKKVGEKSISFTKEFKEIIVREGRSGKSRVNILRDLGFDWNMLGEVRINSMFRRCRNQLARSETWVRSKPTGRPKKVKFSSVEEENRYLKDRMEYLEQENEFLKKLKALQRGDKDMSAPKKNTK
jgi:transposase